MKSTLERIQNWYKTNCNNDWEHSYGYSIETMDNPGWSIKIDLCETALENLDYDKSYQNKTCKNDWYVIKIRDQILDIFYAVLTILNKLF